MLCDERIVMPGHAVLTQRRLLYISFILIHNIQPVELSKQHTPNHGAIFLVGRPSGCGPSHGQYDGPVDPAGEGYGALSWRI